MEDIIRWYLVLEIYTEHWNFSVECNFSVWHLKLVLKWFRRQYMNIFMHTGINVGLYIQSYICKWASQVVLVVKNLPVNEGDARDTGSIPGSGRYPGEGKGSPLQHFCLENSMERGAWWATVSGVSRSWTRQSEHVSVNMHTHSFATFWEWLTTTYSFPAVHVQFAFSFWGLEE